MAGHIWRTWRVWSWRGSARVRPDPSHGKLVIFGKGFDHYAVLMIKTPEQLRAEAQEYRDLLNVMARPVLNVAIEDMAKALERSADALEEASSAA
jgi:hypothetical protein